MDKTVDQLVRQQYLVPRRSVAKLRQLSKQHKVSATEIVRRAIDAYDPRSGGEAVQEAAALELLAEVHGQLRSTMRRIGTEMAALQVRQRALDDGSVRAQARRETESWLRGHPQALAAVAELLEAPRGNGARVRDRRPRTSSAGRAAAERVRVVRR